MSRAEMRRQKRKEEKNNTVVYKFTPEQLETYKREQYTKAKAEAMSVMKPVLEQISEISMAICTNVLITDFWPKSARRNVPKFIKESKSLYESWISGNTDIREVLELTGRYAGKRLLKDDTGVYKFLSTHNMKEITEGKR